jgi:hypothetical protein
MLDKLILQGGGKGKLLSPQRRLPPGIYIAGMLCVKRDVMAESIKSYCMEALPIEFFQ